MPKVLVVTGGSRGIGAATALLGAKRGYKVCVNYREQRERAEQVLAAIAGAGGQAIAAQADVGEEADVARLFATVDRELGPVDALVNNAGVSWPHGPVAELPAEEYRKALAVNVLGSFLCAREAIRRMSTKRGGRGGAIVNLSSAVARLGGAGRVVAYAATKGAIDTFTFGLAQEVGPEGIRVNAVSPGVIDTEIQPPGRIAEMAPQLPLRRAGQAEEVAEAILWLVSDAASYVSGTVLDVSGGR
jgi:NAD(P)-dependent dehydrogenase (short-subunit alcohol dehydrogenase family)